MSDTGSNSNFIMINCNADQKERRASKRTGTCARELI
jgi:hypothetical protein